LKGEPNPKPISQKMSQQSAQAAFKAIPDAERVQSLADMLSRRRYEVDKGARSLLMEYIDELGFSIMEQAALLTSHRGDKTIRVHDVLLILAKKHGIRIPGAPTAAPMPALHKETITTHAVGQSISDSLERAEKKRKEDGEKAKKASKGGRKRKAG